MRSAVLLALLAAWLGAALMVSAVVAHVAFTVLPSRTLAGAVIGPSLRVVFIAGLLTGILSFALAPSVTQPSLLRAQRIGATILALACMAALLVDRRLAAIRLQSGPIDALTATDPRRIMFGRLHGVSVGLLGIGIVAAFAAIVATIRVLRLPPAYPG